MMFAPLLAFLLQLTAGGLQESFNDRADTLEWPREILSADGIVLVYEPQVESLRGDRLRARMAVSVTRGNPQTEVYGGVWIEARVVTDRDRRTVTPVEAAVQEVRFPQASSDDQDRLRQTLSMELPKWQLTFSMDQLRENLRLVEHERIAARNLKNEAPQILYRNHAAVLLEIDGEPVWRALPGMPYFRIANSAFFVVREGNQGPYYLHIPPFWWTASSPPGPWSATEAPPDSAEAAWASEPKPEVPDGDTAVPSPERPEIVVATRPTELLVTLGPPEYVSIPGTDLLYVQNTDDDVFLDIRSQYYYILLSGRWYRKQAGKGSWTYVPPGELPADFSRIPPGSPKEHVLVSVAGTTEATDAVLDAQIPQTTAVPPGPAVDLEITYDGSPLYEPVAGSAVEYIVNTPFAIFRISGRHFCCHQGVWYESTLASGPWAVATRVPDDLYLLPPSCPFSYCSYCHVFGVGPNAIFVGYYPGYRCCLVEGATVVFGTGWHYRPWLGTRACYPRPVTWNTGVRYDSRSRAWSFGLGASGPCAWLGLRFPPAARDHPFPVGVGGWWGGAAIRRAADDVHRTFSFAAQVRDGAAHNLYAQRPDHLAPLRDHWPQPTRPPRPERRLPNNVYSDREGNVFRHPEGGTWEQHHPEGWRRVQPPAPSTPHELPRMDSLHQELQLESQVRDRGRRDEEEYRRPSAPQPRSPPPSRTPPQR